jgi:predicted RNA binding protein YcfA (HicA-like mRNA interferase family)
MKSFGFEGPFSGGRHQFMIKDDITVRIPNPHERDIGRDLLKRILRQAKISKAKWEKL